MKIIIATGNIHKRQKLAEIVSSYFKPIFLQKSVKIEERGEDFLSIAKNKAIDYSLELNSLVISSDGGYYKLAWDHRNRLENTYNINSENNTYYKYDHNNQRLIKYTEEKIFIPPNPHDVPSIEMMASSDPDSEKDMPLDKASGGTYQIRRAKEDKYIDNYFEKNLNDKTRAHINLNGVKIATVKDNDEPYYILGDHLNSSSILVDNSGDIDRLSDYRPYGIISYENNITDLGDDYTFTGKESDEENSLQYFGARYMDNEIGKFVSIDPILVEVDSVTKVLEDPQALNSYAYSRNNPIVLVDKDGNFYQVFTAAAGTVVGAVWGAGDAYNMVKYTFQGNLDKAVQSSDRFMAKTATGLFLGATAGLSTAPALGVLAPGALATINGTAATVGASQADKLDDAIDFAAKQADKIGNATNQSQRARAALESWAQQGKDNLSQKVIGSHWVKHAQELGVKPIDYTKKALDFFVNNKSRVEPFTDRLGNDAFKIWGNPGGIWDTSGKIITSWIDKKY